MSLTDLLTATVFCWAVILLDIAMQNPSNPRVYVLVGIGLWALILGLVIARNAIRTRAQRKEEERKL